MIIETRDSILYTEDSILESFEYQESSLASRGLRREWLSTYFWVVPYSETYRYLISIHKQTNG